MAEQKLAKLVQVVRDGSTAKLVVDGVDFPWFVACRAVVDVSTSEVPSVEITLFADRVEMVNDLTPRGPDA